jgi:hypothetical protein
MPLSVHFNTPAGVIMVNIMTPTVPSGDQNAPSVQFSPSRGGGYSSVGLGGGSSGDNTAAFVFIQVL